MTNYDDRSDGVDPTEAQVASELIAQSAALEADAELNRQYGPPGEHPIESVDGESLASYNLKQIRKTLGMSQQQIADRIAQVSDVKLSQTQIAKIERGERPWRVNEMFAIAEALGVDYHELFTGQPASNDPQMLVLAARLKLQRAEALEDDARELWRDAAYRRFECEEELVRMAAAHGIEEPTVFKVLLFRWYRRRRAEEEQIVGFDPPSQAEIDHESAELFAREEWNRYLREAAEKRSKRPANDADEESGQE